MPCRARATARAWNCFITSRARRSIRSASKAWAKAAPSPRRPPSPTRCATRLAHSAPSSTRRRSSPSTSCARWRTSRRVTSRPVDSREIEHAGGSRRGMITTMTSTGGTAFVFTGGGSLGAIQVGMLRTLLSHGVRPDFVVGSSVGAINASYFAAAPNLDGVAALERIWSGLRRSDVFPLTLVSALGLLMHPGNLVDPVGLGRLIEPNLPYRCLEEEYLPLHIMATNQQGQPVRLSSGPAVEAILASTAIPGVFPPVEIGGEALMGGA